MSLETLDLESKGSNMRLDEEHHFCYTVFELKDILDKDDIDLEKSFETKEADSETVELAIEHYESIMNSAGAFVGIGNTALVFKQHPETEKSEQCVKCRWDFLMVNNKSKKVQELPENLRRLKMAEIHFKEVNDKKRSLQRKGMDFVADNSVLREAMIQRTAHTILAEAGMQNAVPDINFIIKIDREESGEVNGDPFVVSEAVNLMFMEQVQGMNLEEMIYQGAPSVAEKMDIPSIEQKLREMVGLLHEGGIAHRDLSLRNIMLDSETLEPRIIDFGKSIHQPVLQEADKERDIQFVDEAVRFLTKFKKDPQRASADLKELHI